ncbi:MAG: cytochrome P450 [Burkholderiaceae bacterium]
MSMPDEALREHVASLPIESFDVSQPALFENDTVEAYFARLRDEAPVHFCPRSAYGPYWSITRYADIISVDANHRDFSSDAFKGGAIMFDFPKGHERPNFMHMDPPEHDAKRKVVSPIVAPANLARLEDLIRERVDDILDNLPRGEVFNWVDRVSIELTSRMLATIFGFPYDERRRLIEWSEIATHDINTGGPIDSEEKRRAALQPCLEAFTELMRQRAAEAPRADLISMLAHSPRTNAMSPQEFLATMTLLIIGGNDTTRNSITGGLLAMHEHPDQWRKLRENPALVTTAVSEIIRWQTPLSHMRRNTVTDVQVNGQMIPAGSKVIMWYLSGNRDERAIENPHAFVIDRPRARQHLSFGFGVHRCVGNRLAEMQLRLLWEGILARGLNIEVTGPARRVRSNLIHGFSQMPVIVH